LKFPPDPNASTFKKSGIPTEDLQYLYEYTGKTSSNDTNFSPIYSADPPLLPAIAVPLYTIATTFSIDPVHFVPFFLNSIILALTSLIIFLLSNEIYSSKKIAFVLSLLFSICSFAWPYVTSMLLQPLAALTLVSSLYFVALSKRKNSIFYPALSSLFLGLTLLAHIGHLILIPGFFIFSIYHYRNKVKTLIVFLSIFSP